MACTSQGTRSTFSFWGLGQAFTVVRQVLGQSAPTEATSCSCRTRCCQPLRHFMRCWSIWQRIQPELSILESNACICKGRLPFRCKVGLCIDPYLPQVFLLIRTGLLLNDTFCCNHNGCWSISPVWNTLFHLPSFQLSSWSRGARDRHADTRQKQ